MAGARDVLAVIYLTYLLTRAEILDAPRSHLLQWRFFQRLLSCPFCTGLWAAVIVTLTPPRLRDILGLAGANLIFWNNKE